MVTIPMKDCGLCTVTGDTAEDTVCVPWTQAWVITGEMISTGKSRHVLSPYEEKDMDKGMAEGQS